MRKLKLLLAACALFGVTATAWADDVLDITDLYLTNPGFESGDTNGWTVGSSSDTGARSTSDDTYKMSNSEGSFLFNTWWQGIPITQTIESLPAGSYTLTSVVASDGATVYMISGENSAEYEYTETTDSKVGIQLTKNFTLTETTNYKIGAVGGADGTAGEHKDYKAEGYWWYKADNFRLYLNLSEGATIPAAIVQKLLADKPTGTMSTSAQTALDKAISAFENNATLANYNAALEAMANARKSIASLAIIASGTIPLENAVGWGKTTSGSLNYNTWSGEGASDGSNMTTPFIENHISPKTDEVENYLGEGKLYYRLTNLTPGDKYSVSALVRIVSQIGKPISGAYFYANDGKKNIADVSFDCTNGIAGTMYAVGTVDADGVLEIGLESSATSTFNWMAIKDVKIASYAGTSVSSIALSESSVEVRTGDVLNLTVSSISPEGADDKNYTWSSDNEDVATVVRGKVLTLDAGSATITATACDGSGVTGTCTITVVDAAAPANWSNIADVDQGDFFIRNVGTGKFLGGANSWGTQASLIKHGIPFGVAKAGEGSYTLDSYTYNNSTDHYFNGTFVDGGSTKIYVESVGSGKYAIYTIVEETKKYVTANAGNTVVDNTAKSSDASLAQWQFLSADDMLKNLKDGDTDATFFLSEANISRNLRKSSGNSAWVGEFSYGGNNDNQCAESINKTHDVYQTVSVPNGTYTVKVQGFYRPGESAIASKFYANTEEVDLKKYNDETLPAESMAGASTAFTAGRFWNTIEDVTVTDNKLTIGVKTEATDSWTIWDNFELELTTTSGLNVTESSQDVFLTADEGQTYIYRGADSGTQGVVSAINELYANIKTNIAGISTITFYDKLDKNGLWGERLFLSNSDGDDGNVYTDGKRHVEKNYHHHYWAVESSGSGYKFRNIEYGKYLGVGEGNVLAMVSESDAAVWTFDTKATDLSSISDKITAAEAKTLGFEKDEYAPYNNVEALKALAAVNAFDDATKGVPSLKVSAMGEALENWTANTEEVNAIAYGDLSSYETLDGKDYPYGWSKLNDGSRIMGGSEGTDNEGLSASSTGKAMLLKYNANYGNTTGYTLPLKAGKIYKITFKYCGWGNNPTTNIVLTDPENNAITLAPGFRPATNNGYTNAEHWYDYTGYFVSTTAGNYVLAMNKVESGQQQIAWADMKLLSADAIEFADGSVPTYAPGTYPTVKINREFSTSNWSTAVYPFAVNTGTIATLKSFEDGNLAFQTATASEANVPFMIKNDGAITLENVEVAAAAATDATQGDASLKGVYTATDIDNTAFNYVLKDNKIYKVGTAGATVNPYRAYIQLTEAADPARLTFTVDGEVTAIEGVAADKTMDGTIYNLNGQRVKTAKKGVYVVNGKAVIVK